MRLGPAGPALEAHQERVPDPHPRNIRLSSTVSTTDATMLKTHPLHWNRTLMIPT